MDLHELISLIDQAAGLETDRLELDRRSKGIKVQEDDLKARIMRGFDELGLSALAGHSGKTASMEVSQEPVVNDWPAFHVYIKENNALDLLHRRVTASAVKLRWADGIVIPGVDRYESKKLVIS